MLGNPNVTCIRNCYDTKENIRYKTVWGSIAKYIYLRIVKGSNKKYNGHRANITLCSQVEIYNFLLKIEITLNVVLDPRTEFKWQPEPKKFTSTHLIFPAGQKNKKYFPNSNINFFSRQSRHHVWDRRSEFLFFFLAIFYIFRFMKGCNFKYQTNRNTTVEQHVLTKSSRFKQEVVFWADKMFVKEK